MSGRDPEMVVVMRFTYGGMHQTHRVIWRIRTRRQGSCVLVLCSFPFNYSFKKKKKVSNCGLSNSHIEFKPVCADLPEVVTTLALLEKLIVNLTYWPL